MEFEIWASDSGNRLLVTHDLDRALAWALDYWLLNGNDALAALSISDDQDQSVLVGRPLRELLRGRLWPARAAPWETSANESLQSVPYPQLTLAAGA